MGSERFGRRLEERSAVRSRAVRSPQCALEGAQQDAATCNGRAPVESWASGSAPAATSACELAEARPLLVAHRQCTKKKEWKRREADEM